jgi:hypothetical protein
MVQDREAEVEDALQAPVVPAENAIEAELTSQIRTLWIGQARTRENMSSTRKKLRSQRIQLGERLSQMKELLARPGRAGNWAKYLKLNHWPRATADRYVDLYERSLAPAENRLTEAIPAASPEEQACALVRRLLPQLRRILTSQPAVDRFFTELALAIPPTGLGAPKAA